VSPVKNELGFYIPEDTILHSHRRGNLKSYNFEYVPQLFAIHRIMSCKISLIINNCGMMR
jgi:hypothetical protein